MNAAFLWALLLISDFSDTVTCTVSGYLWHLDTETPVEFSRVDQCPGIRMARDTHALILYSPHIWVRVLIPPDKGHRRFMYRWGTGAAHLGPETIPIQWGRVTIG